jgi:hypothetical protein
LISPGTSHCRILNVGRETREQNFRTTLVAQLSALGDKEPAQWAWRRNGDDGGDDGDGGAGQSVLYREAAIESRIFAAIAPASVDRVAGEWVRGHEWRGWSK